MKAAKCGLCRTRPMKPGPNGIAECEHCDRACTTTRCPSCADLRRRGAIQ